MHRVQEQRLSVGELQAQEQQKSKSGEQRVRGREYVVAVAVFRAIQEHMLVKQFQLRELLTFAETWV